MLRGPARLRQHGRPLKLGPGLLSSSRIVFLRHEPKLFSQNLARGTDETFFSTPLRPGEA